MYETAVKGEAVHFEWSGQSVLLRTSEGFLYMSRDEGATWQEQSSVLGGGVGGLFMDAGKTRAALTSLEKEGVWLGLAPAFAWEWAATPGLRFERLVPSPHADHEVLGLTEAKELHLSVDFGRSWRLVASEAQQVTWDPVQEGQFYHLGERTLFVHDRTLVDVPLVIKRDCAGFYVRGNTMLVATVGQGSLELYVSYDAGKSLSRMYFPSADATQRLTEGGYFVLGLEEGSVFLCVLSTQVHDYCTMYVAGTADGRFEVSLERVYGRPPDFSQVGSVPGVYVTNVVQEDGVSLQTMITRDNGAVWEPLDVQLTGRNEEEGTRFYSTPGAVGLMAGTGAVGTAVPRAGGEMRTFLTRDAGSSWTQVASEAMTYEFGDRGGLLVMARKAEEASAFAFSWNEGDSFTECALSAPLRVGNIRVEPSASSNRFVIHGSRSGGDGDVLVSVDFSGEHERLCRMPDQPGTPESDYELWRPATGCVLGTKMEYARRIPSRACFNTVDDSHHREQACACGRADYECDDCFRAAGGGMCVRYSSQCAQQACWRSQGYRKAPGNKCAPEDPAYAPSRVAGCDTGTGGTPTTVPAASSSLGPALAAVAVIGALLALVLGLAVAARKSAAVNAVARKCFPERCCPLWAGGGAGGVSYGSLGDHSLDLEEEAELMHASSIDEEEEEEGQGPSFGEIFSS